MAPRKKVLMAASGDLRQSANETCWPAQAAMEKQVVEALAAFDVEVERAHPYDPARKHGFIASQKEGLEIFSKIDSGTPIIVAEAVWQYSNHVLPGLIGHRAPILTVANWSGQWPGLVGMLNLNGSLTKAGVSYSTLWSESFTDDLFKKKLHQWLQVGHVTPRPVACSSFRSGAAPERARAVAKDVASKLPPSPGDHGHFRRGLHGDVQRHHPRRTAVPDRRLQGALVAVGALRGLARRARGRGPRRLRLACRQGHDLPFRQGSGDRARHRPGDRPVPHVHRRRPDCGRLRLRHDRDPVPAGHEGPDARLRPRRGHAQQR